MIIEEPSGWGLGPLILLLGLLLLALFVFWCLIPFALFGIRRRLDRIARTLEEMRNEARGGGAGAVLGRAGAALGRREGEEGRAAQSLFAELRELFRGLSPGLREEVVDSQTSEFILSLGEGSSPFARLSLEGGGVEISFHLKSLARNFPTFEGEEFENSLWAHLHEKYGFSARRPPDGSELILHLEPPHRSGLEPLSSILREKILDRLPS